MLAQALAIDAWHEPMRFDGESFSVHVELSFKSGRIGGDDPAYPFTFDIALKKAVLVLKIEAPLAIDRRTVARSIPSSTAELSRLIDAKEEAKANIEFGGKISPESLSVALGGGLSSSSVKSQERHLKLVQELPRIIANPQPRGPTEYAWELTPGQSETLDGQPWDPVEQPRFSVRYKANGVPKIAPVITATVSCRLEDVDITNLRLKDTSIVAVFKEMTFNRVNVAAAIQHLKFSLRDMQLEVGDFGDPLSSMNIAEIILTEA